MKKIFFYLFIFVLATSCTNNIPGMVLIPKGEFTMGINPDQKVIQFMSDMTLARNAQPAQKLYLKDFFIDKFEVTYEEFRLFKPILKYTFTNSREPIRGVNWYEADAYCISVGKRLPTESEWEKAARGTDERLFVWGSQFLKENSNFGKHINSIGSNSKDISIYGVVDMNGNVSEWTATWYNRYKKSQLEDKLFGKQVKVLRGGSFHKIPHGFMKEFTMLPYRNFAPPKERFWDTGFRCAKSI